MNREKVDSSNIEAFGYDADDELLEVEFKSGDVFEYYQVPEKTVLDFRGADSKGKYFNQKIRTVYRFCKLP